jgi:hypothetical protein
MHKTPPQAPRLPKNQQPHARNLLTVWSKVWQEGTPNAAQLPPMVGAVNASQLTDSLTRANAQLVHSPHVWLDRIEDLVMQDGWPVPLSRYYLIHHDRLLYLLDQLRASLYENDHGHPHPLVSPLVSPLNHPVYTNKPYKNR